MTEAEARSRHRRAPGSRSARRLPGQRRRRAQDRVIEQDPNRDQFVEPGSDGRPRGLHGQARRSRCRSWSVRTAPRPRRRCGERRAATVDFDGARVRRAGRTRSSRPTRRGHRGAPRAPDGHGVLLRRSRGGPRRGRAAAGRGRAAILREAGFDAGRGRVDQHHRAQGHRHRPEPRRRQPAARGPTVTIVVSAYEEPSESPSPPRARRSRRPTTPADRDTVADRRRPAPGETPARPSGQRSGSA